MDYSIIGAAIFGALIGIMALLSRIVAELEKIANKK